MCSARDCVSCNHLGRSLFPVLVAVMLTGAMFGPARTARAAGPRALAEGQLPDDYRLGPLKDLNGYFPFAPSRTPEDWQRRAERLRRRTLVALGLWPMPTKTPLKPVIHGRVDRGDYTVEKVCFQSFPGFFVTGNLYRPKSGDRRRPGVLCPHGHWADGRFYDQGADKVRREIARGAERYEEGGRSPLQARCVQLARMGCVVFHYDMIGYADSVQITRSLAHGFAKQRPEMNARENWGLFSPQAEAHLESVMGMQAFNSIRALDFLTGLPDVDSGRLAVTGASGGGTQSFILAAIEPRLAVAVPAVMVSTAMQGGCTCENASLLRVGTGNVEIAALFAPRPMLLIAANDWTKEMPAKGFPELQQHYKMLGAADRVALEAHLEFGHNYNYVNRAAMYRWMNRYLRLGLTEPIVEKDYKRLTRREMSVWDDEHPRPEGGPEFERRLLRWMTDDARRQIAALAPTDEPSLARYREIVGGAIDVLIGRRLGEGGKPEFHQVAKKEKENYVEIVGLVRHAPAADEKEELPVVILRPKEPRGQTVVWITPHGKSGLYDVDGRPIAPVKKLIDAGRVVIGVDLLYQGEFLADGRPITKTRRVKNPREAAAYTFGYNPTLFARRVHDILAVVALARSRRPALETVALVGLRGAGAWVAAARAVAGGAVDRAAVDTGGFRFGNVTDIHDENFLPGGAKYDDLPGMLALSAPGKLWLAGEGEKAPPPVRAAYRAAGKPDAVTLFAGRIQDAGDAAVRFLIQDFALR